MKRCFTLLLSFLLLLGCVPMVSAEGVYNDDQLNWGDLTCFHTDAIEVEGQPSTCAVAGYTSYLFCESCRLVLSGKEPLPLPEHTYDYACDAECNVCGGVREAEEHNYELVHENAPTCAIPGEQTYGCTVCGDSYTETIPATGHVYDDDADVDCNVCGEPREIEVLLGDADGNGKLNNRDLGKLQQYLNGYAVEIYEAAADMDGNGKLNNRDLGMLQRLLNQ